MDIHEVKTLKDSRCFHNVARRIYRDDEHWVCPLDDVIEGIFSPSENTFFSHGEATRWYLTDSRGHLIGRVAAFINKQRAYIYEQPTGGMGFFECIDDKEAAFTLFDTARVWLQARGMQAMDGPVNFGENDNFWGLLVEGFSQPSYGMQYNPLYYKTFFEAYGFRPLYEQITNTLDMKQGLPSRFLKVAQWVAQKKEYRFEHFSFDQKERYFNAILDVYNSAWQSHDNFAPMEYGKLEDAFKEAKPVVDPELIWFVFHRNNDEPAAFFVMYPDANMILKYFDGKLKLWNKLRFYYMKKRHYMTRARIIIMGVKPKYQNLGLESGIFANLNEVMKRRPWIRELELSWVGDFNQKMQALHKAAGGKFAKKHVTYRLHFK
ncbi:MAG: hypothetical protein R6U19_10435 [Bacteroidales bacterium]